MRKLTWISILPTTRRAGAPTLGLALAVLVGLGALPGCSSADQVAKPNPVTFSPPDKAGLTPLHGVPIPKGAEPDPTKTTVDTEAFVIKPPVTLLDVSAFYKREMDGKAFGEFEWCGPYADGASDLITRVWRRPAAGELLLVSLQNPSTKDPTLITITKSTGVALVEVCA